MKNSRLDLWIFGSLFPELELLVRELQAREEEEKAGVRWFLAEARKMRVGLGLTGVGVASASFSVGLLLSHSPSPKAIMVGSCGALPGSGLKVGDLVVASSEIFSELGVLEKPGIGNTEGLIGLGLEQEIPLEEKLGVSLLQAARGLGRVSQGRLITVAGVSASIPQARARRKRFGALAENMEGYGLALAARKIGFEAAEIRGVSNKAGERDRALWDLNRAQVLAQRAALTYIEGSLP